MADGEEVTRDNHMASGLDGFFYKGFFYKGSEKVRFGGQAKKISFRHCKECDNEHPKAICFISKNLGLR